MPEAVFGQLADSCLIGCAVQHGCQELQRHQCRQRDHDARHQRQAHDRQQRHSRDPQHDDLTLCLHRRKHGCSGKDRHYRQQIDQVDRNGDQGAKHQLDRTGRSIRSAQQLKQADDPQQRTDDDKHHAIATHQTGQQVATDNLHNGAPGPLH